MSNCSDTCCKQSHASKHHCPCVSRMSYTICSGCSTIFSVVWIIIVILTGWVIIRDYICIRSRATIIAGVTSTWWWASWDSWVGVGWWATRATTWGATTWGATTRSTTTSKRTRRALDKTYSTSMLAKMTANTSTFVCQHILYLLKNELHMESWRSCLLVSSAATVLMLDTGLLESSWACTMARTNRTRLVENFNDFMLLMGDERLWFDEASRHFLNQ